MREFTRIESVGNDLYDVTTTKIKKGKKVVDTYRVDLKTHYCQCKAWFYSEFPKKCPHLNEVVTQLRAKGHIIIWNKKEQGHYDLGLVKCY